MDPIDFRSRLVPASRSRDTPKVVLRIIVPVLMLTAALGVGQMDAVRASPKAKSFEQGDGQRLRAGRSVPWRRRQRTGVAIIPDRYEQSINDLYLPHRRFVSMAEARRLGLRPRRRGARDITAWPREPSAPRQLHAGRFTAALARLCPRGTPVDPIAAAVLDASQRVDGDPFLLAALLFHESRCDPTRADSYGLGLARINPGMYEPGLTGGAYRYGLPDGHGGFVREHMMLDRHEFSVRSLMHIAPNVYFAAAFLKVFEAQCPAIDDLFDSVPHRSAVSHFVWGDRVRGTLPEEQILTARRRLLHDYAPTSGVPVARFGSTRLSSPLDGAPRLVIGVMGDMREGGRRVHAGIDLDAAIGEPVRAIAPGVVTFAGTDLRDHGLLPMEPERARDVHPERMGPRGLFVTVLHDDGFESLYSHLADYRVRMGMRVRRGEKLGHVGRTGMHASDAHLHLGVLVDRIAIDPLPLLKPYLVPANLAPPARAVRAAQNGAARRRIPAAR